MNVWFQRACTIAELVCRNQNGIWSDEMNRHSCIHCNYQLLKQSNIDLCSVHWSILGLFPCYPCPKLKDHLLPEHQKMPEDWIHIFFFIIAWAVRFWLSYIFEAQIYIYIYGFISICTIFLTLYHVNGCCFWDAKDPWIQLIDEIEFG